MESFRLFDKVLVPHPPIKLIEVATVNIILPNLSLYSSAAIQDKQLKCLVNIFLTNEHPACNLIGPLD